jgi:hypothetical protein
LNQNDFANTSSSSPCTRENKTKRCCYLYSKDYEIGICCFSAKHAAIRRKSKDWLARNHVFCVRVGQHVYSQTVVSVNLIKIRSTHLLPIFYRFLLVAACVGSNNTPLRVASGVNMNALSEIYISQSEIESISQNNQSENRFLSVFGAV